jgi:hypothetical protein
MGETMTEAALIDRLTEAAAAAVAEVASTLEHDPRRLQSVTIELEVSNQGEVVEAVVRSQRRAGVARGRR